MELIISSIVGGIIGLVIAIIFQEPLQSAKRRLVKWFQIGFYRPGLTPTTPQSFGVGKFHVPWLVIEGDGEMTYSPETITCTVDNTSAPLPPEVVELRDRIEKTERGKKDKGQFWQRNGPLYALDRYSIGRTQPDERMEVFFNFRLTDYYTFQATVMRLDENLVKPPAIITLRQKYLQDQDITLPIPFLANGFGIVLAIITKDRKLILTRRSDEVWARPGELDVSVVEGVHPVLDRSSFQHGPDLYRTAIRGAQEEIGIELIQEDITFLGFGLDITYYQWNLLGTALVSETANKTSENRRRGIGGKWETKDIEIIESDPIHVFTYLENRKMWSAGFVAIYWALVYNYGRKRVDSALKKIFDS